MLMVLMQWLLAVTCRVCISACWTASPVDDGFLTFLLLIQALSGREATTPCVRSQPALLSDTGWAYRKSEANDLESGTSAEDCACL